MLPLDEVMLPGRHPVPSPQLSPSPQTKPATPLPPFALLQSSNRELSRLYLLSPQRIRESRTQSLARTSWVPCSNGIVRVALLFWAFYFRTRLPFRPLLLPLPLYSSLLSLQFSVDFFLVTGWHSFLSCIYTPFCDVPRSRFNVLFSGRKLGGK